MSGDNSGPGEFQLDSKRSFGPTISPSVYASNGHLYCRSRDAGNDYGHSGRWPDVYGKSFTDMQLNRRESALELITA